MFKKNASRGISVTRVLLVSLFIGLTAVITASAMPSGSFAFLDSVKEFFGLERAGVSVLKEQPGESALDNEARGAKPTASPTVLSSTVGKDNSEPTNDAVNLYPVTRTTGITFSSISGTGTSVTSWRNALSTDDNLSNSQPIGFPFTYNGGVYSNFLVSTNGVMTFNTGTAAIGSGSGNAYSFTNANFSTSGATCTCLAIGGFYDDLQTAGNLGTLADLNASIKYQTTGSSPSRVLTVEWINMQDFNTGSVASLNWQVKLYEADGHIEFVYGTMTTGAASWTYTDGINASAIVGTPTAAELLTQQTANTNTFSNLASNALTTIPATNTQLTFTPPTTTPAAATGLSFPNKGATYAQMTWTDNATNEINYNVLISSDAGATFQTFGGIFAANTNGLTVTGLAPSTSYVFRVLACTEAVCSTPLDNSVTTNATVSGTKTIGAGGDYPSFALAITDVNAGVGGAGVTFNIAAGTTFAENGTCITGGSVTTPVIFQKSGAGANPIIQPPGSSSTQDSGICIFGGDYITFDGIDVNGNAGGLVEYGALVFNSAATNGAQNNTIKNSKITLNRTNTGSIGINQANAATATSAAGANSSNKYYNITIENASRGILLTSSTTSFPDLSCEIGILPGGTTTIGSATANDIGGGTAATFGISAVSESGLKIFNTEVRNVGVTSGSVLVDGIFVSGFIGSNDIYNNKVHDIKNSSTTATTGIAGIRATHNTTGTNVARIYNNFVYGITSGYTGAASATRQIKGIFANGTGGSTSQEYDVDFNSVRLDTGASSTISSSCFEISVASASVNKVRNNIFANLTGAQSGVAKHYTWVTTSATAIGGTGSVSNNNDLYVSNTTNGFIGLGNATDYATIANWRTGVSQDAASISADPLFVSATDLHVSGVSPVVNAGQTIAGISQDIDGQNRVGVPDIGADEPGGVTPNANDMSATAFIDPLNGGAKVANTAFAPQASFTNVGTATQTSVTVRYIIKDAGLNEVYNQTATIASSVQNQTSNVTFPNATISLGGNYTTTARTELAGDQDASNDSISGTLIIKAPLSGNVNVGTGQTYTTLTAAVADLNSLGVSAATTLTLTDATYPGETFPITINAFTGASSGNRVTIKPASGISPLISGSSTSCVITFNGADFVTIDGSNAIGGTSRDLTISNTSTAAATGGVCVVSLGTALGATNDIVKNTNIAAGANQATGTNTTFGIYSGGSGALSITNDGVDNDTNTFQNNAILTARYGISVRGGVSNANDNVTISQNLVGPAAFGSTAIGRDGIVIQHQNLANVSQNEVRFVGGDFANRSTFGKAIGIGIGSETGPTATTTIVTNSTITRNLIHDIVDEKTGSAIGILVGEDATASSGNIIANNMVYNIHANGTSTDQTIGLAIAGGNGDKVVFNSISLTGDVDPGSSSTSTENSSGIRIVSTTPVNLTLKNNIVSSDVSSNTGTLRHFAFVKPSATYSFGTGGCDNNDYFVNSSNTQMVLFGNGTATPYTNVTTLGSWQGETPAHDAASKNAIPNFTSSTNLHILNGAGDPVSLVARAGVTVSGITTDYDGNTRKATPDIGADEFDTYLLTVGAAAGGAITAPVSSPAIVNSGAATTITATANAGFTFTGWTVVAGAATFGNAALLSTTAAITGDASVQANFTPTTYQLSVVAGTGGIITDPASPPVTVNHGVATTITATANVGYTFANWTVTSGAGSIASASSPSTTITLTSGDATVQANFTINTYAITSSAGPNGSISPNGSTLVNHGDNQTYTIAPALGYHVDTLTVDGGSVPAANSYTFTNVTTTHTIAVTFAIDTYTINASAGLHGSISPSGAVSVNPGANQSFTITADPGYHVDTLTVDGGSVAPATSYTFTNVTANHTIHATFLIDPTITVVGGPLNFGNQGILTPSAEQTYTVAGMDLTGDITVTSPSTDFEVSLTTLIGFGPSVTVPQIGGTVATTTIYVRFVPQSLGLKSGDITNATPGAATQNVAVSGTGVVGTVTTSTTVISVTSPSTYGDSVTFTATVIPGVTTGDVTFIEGGTCAIPAIIHSGPTAVSIAGTASFSTSALTATTHTITACYGGAPGYTSSSGSVVQTVNKATPTVTFGAAPTPTYLGGNFTVSASTTNTDSSALIYSVVSGPCALVSGATFSSSGAGTCVVRADGAATTNFNAAFNTQSVTIAKATPIVTFNAAPAATFPGTNFTVSASTTNTDSAALTYSKVSGPCDFVSGATFTPTGAGNCVVQADGAATANFTAASSQQTVAITQVTYLLTVTNGGNGLVTSSPPGINCGVDCTETYNADTVVTLTATPDVGYSFNGWTGDCSGVGACILTMSAAKTVGATFTINQYSVTYDANGGTGVQSDPSSPYNAGTSVTVLGQGGITRTGYTFAGWNTASDGSGTNFSPSDTFTIFGNITFYAKWTINQYTVSYDGNGNTGGTAPATQMANFGSSITLAGAGTLVRTGYTFNGWNTMANGLGTPYAAGASFTIPAQNTTLYAQWTVVQYSVFYNGNGNTGGTAPATQTANFGSSITLAGAGSLVRTGYTFAGWNTASDGSGTGYAGGASFTIPASDTTLYAQWTINQYTVLYDANGGTGSQNDPSSPYNHGSTVTVLGTGSIARTGYTFTNWNTASDGSGTIYSPAATFTITANTTLYAQWTINTYTITATAGANGSISPNGAVSVNHGADQSFAITPNAGYHVDTLTVDAIAIAPALSYTFTNVTATHTIAVTFAINTYTITATAGANGSISPNGAVSVNHGANQLFTITPSAGFHVDVLTVDGSSVPAAASYTFMNVTATHTIDVTFAANPTPVITFDAAPTPTYLGGDFTVNATTTNTDSSALTYSVVSGPCALVSGATFSSTGAGTCQVQASGAATANYTAATATQNVTIAKANQATVTLSGVPATATYGDTFTAVGGGGSGTGAFSYAVTGTACTVHPSTGAGSVVAVTGGCSVTATRAGDTNFNPATSAASVITTINPANQATLTAVATPSTVPYGTTSALSSTGGSGTGAVTFSAGASTGCSVVGTTLSVIDASQSCVVTATKAADANYNQATSAGLTVTLTTANQATLTVDDPGTVTYGSTPQLTTSGGSGTGAVTFSDGGSAGCSVTSGGVLTVINASAACNVTATKAADTNYNATTSAQRTITLAKANQAALTAVATPSSVTYGSTSALSSTGGSGTGAVTFSSGASTGCSVLATTLSVTDASQTCAVTATKATDNNYNAATSAPLTVTLVKATPTVTFGAAPTPTYLGGNFTVSASTTNTDSSTLTYSVVSGPCALVSGATFSSSGAGTCQVQASGAATSNFTTASATQNVAIAKATPTVTFGAAPTPAYPGANFTVSASTTNTDSSALTYSRVSGPCTFVSGATFSSTGAGTCIVRADGAASTNFNAAFDTQNVTIAAVQYTINASAGPNGSITPSGAVVVSSGANQAFTIAADAGYHIVDVLVDSVSQGATGLYTFTNVTANHTISASFAINTYTIAASAGANGTITPSGSVVVNHGANQSFTITPDGGYNVANVLVDGISVGAVTSHTFTNVTANHTISATFFSGTQALIVYVDDNWVGTPLGTDPDGAGPASSFGYDAFATIQDGVAGVAINGTVIVNPGSYTGDIDVNRAIDVKGVFTTSGAVTVTAPGASISPGTSPGIINTGNLSLTAGSNVNIEVNGPIVGTQYDQLNVTGTVSLGNANLNVTVDNLYTPAVGQTFTIVNNDGSDPVTGTFAGLAEADVFYTGTTSFRISYAGGSNSNDVVLTTVALCNSVSLTNHTSLTGNPVVASVNVDNTTGNALQSTDLTITYNPAVVTYSSASLGTVTAGSVLNINSSTPGTLIVSIFNALPFSGAGSMLNITFNTVGQPGTSTPLAFSAFKFNEGTQCISTSNGSVSVISGTITGTVTYGNSLPAATRHVPNTTIDAVGSVNASVLTNLAGAYSISSLGAGPYTVTPSRTGGVNGALTGMDAAQIAQWVVGTTSLNATQQTVGDVSGTGGLTSFDSALIARYVVSLPNAGSSGTWRFTPTSTTYPNVNVNRFGDYTALLMGDVSGNWIDPLATRPAQPTEELKPIEIAAPELSAQVNSEVMVPVQISDTTNKGIVAYQFELRYDPSVLDPAVNTADLTDTISSGYQVTVNATERGLLRVVVFGAQPLSGGGRLINLRFNVIGNPGSVSELAWENLGLNEGGFDIRSVDGRVEVTASPSNNASIGGRVMSAEGQPIRNARVTLIDTTGQSRYVMTGSLGYYQFTGLQTGETYTVRASAKRHRFHDRTVSVTGEVTTLDIIAEPGG